MFDVDSATPSPGKVPFKFLAVVGDFRSLCVGDFFVVLLVYDARLADGSFSGERLLSVSFAVECLGTTGDSQTADEF